MSIAPSRSLGASPRSAANVAARSPGPDLQFPRARSAGPGGEWTGCALFPPDALSTALFALIDQPVVVAFIDNMSFRSIECRRPGTRIQFPKERRFLGVDDKRLRGAVGTGLLHC